MLDKQRQLPPVSTTSKEAASVFDARADKTWLSPISMSKLKAAVEKKAKTVVLNDGRLYNITYNVMFHSKVNKESYPCVKLKRADGVMAPFGYVSMKRIDNFEFENDD